jgi:hypothetical protein
MFQHYDAPVPTEDRPSDSQIKYLWGISNGLAPYMNEERRQQIQNMCRLSKMYFYDRSQVSQMIEKLIGIEKKINKDISEGRLEKIISFFRETKITPAYFRWLKYMTSRFEEEDTDRMIASIETVYPSINSYIVSLEEKPEDFLTEILFHLTLMSKGNLEDIIEENITKNINKEIFICNVLQHICTKNRYSQRIEYPLYNALTIIKGNVQTFEFYRSRDLVTAEDEIRETYPIDDREKETPEYAGGWEPWWADTDDDDDMDFAPDSVSPKTNLDDELPSWTWQNVRQPWDELQDDSMPEIYDEEHPDY